MEDNWTEVEIVWKKYYIFWCDHSLEHYGYAQDNKGKTSGSRVRFVMEGHADILLHRPHPQKELKEYVIKDLHNIIEQEGFWNE